MHVYGSHQLSHTFHTVNKCATLLKMTPQCCPTYSLHEICMLYIGSNANYRLSLYDQFFLDILHAVHTE